MKIIAGGVINMTKSVQFVEGGLFSASKLVNFEEIINNKLKCFSYGTKIFKRIVQTKAIIFSEITPF